jgi:hypothetical protein
MEKERDVKSTLPPMRGANSGAMQSRGQSPIAALQPVHSGMVIVWVPAIPAIIPQPMLLPRRRVPGAVGRSPGAEESLVALVGDVSPPPEASEAPEPPLARPSAPALASRAPEPSGLLPPESLLASAAPLLPSAEPLPVPESEDPRVSELSGELSQLAAAARAAKPTTQVDARNFISTLLCVNE